MTDTAVTSDATVATHGVLLTDAAADKVRSLLEQEGRDDLRLRVAVQPGGCSGLIYQLYFDERFLDGDVAVDFDGVEVIVDDNERAVSRWRDDRFQGHDLRAGLHDRQPERIGKLRLRRQLPLSADVQLALIRDFFCDRRRGHLGEAAPSALSPWACGLNRV